MSVTQPAQKDNSKLKELCFDVAKSSPIQPPIFPDRVYIHVQNLQIQLCSFLATLRPGNRFLKEGLKEVDRV
jgi:hypothetical protein